MRSLALQQVPWIAALVVAVILAATTWDVLRIDSGQWNLFAHQAQAFLHGRLDIDQQLYDVSVFQGKFYPSFPPFPAIMLMPFVFAAGIEGTRVVLLSILISGLSALLLIQILGLLEVNRATALWATAAFFFGTAYASAVRLSTGVWYFAHVVAVACVLLAIYAALGRGSGTLTGLFLGLAFLTRQATIFSSIALVALLLLHPRNATQRSKRIALMGFGVVLGLCVGMYLVFNWARFGNPLDTGYAYIQLPGFLKERVDRYGLFSPAYMPFNFTYMFLQGFHLEYDPQTYLTPIRSDPFGTAITFASPFIFAALWARWDRRLLAAAWLSIGLTLASHLLYYNNGSLQLNAQRFTLDFWPILILLVARGVPYVNPKLWRAAVIFSIGLNVITLVVAMSTQS